VRGNISDQDLTDYALNELQDGERLYLESMLAVSEECREDIYKMIDLAQMLEEGFERDIIVAERQELALREEQRENLIQPHFTRRYVIRDIISGLGVAACVAFAAAKFDSYDFRGAQQVAGRVAHASTVAAGAMTNAVQSPETIDLAKSLEALRSLAEEGAKLVPVGTDLLPEPPTICTPPTLIMESAQLTNFGEMGQ
jgi:anti-sigma factor RsiW